ncbi:MAG TPA: DUF4347 domain-containing protein, partial [Burkholderiaceae bacterium]|nr:DUF4347 domain-containing protein [Burkholderiaceae bacterium]
MNFKHWGKRLVRGRASREVRQSLFRRRPVFEALEKRYLMSAELLPPPPADDDAAVVEPYDSRNHDKMGRHPYLGERFAPPAVLGKRVNLDDYGQHVAGLDAVPDTVQQGIGSAAPDNDERLPDALSGLDAPDALSDLDRPDALADLDAPDALSGTETSGSWSGPDASGTHSAPIQSAPGLDGTRDLRSEIRLDGYTTHNEHAPVRQIIFVDPGIENAEQLIKGLYSLASGKTEGLGRIPLEPVGDDAELRILRSHDLAIVMLDARYDGVDQITQILSHHDDLDAIQIMSHGRPGALHLGNAVLDGDGVSGAYRDQIKAWGRALTDEGDIMLYGCHVAGSGTGIDFVDSLSAITRADVAASTSAVGSAELGGDWVLDYRNGSIEASTVTVSHWFGLLSERSGHEDGSSTLV